jgi:Mg2+ and Co2+ transporter CorA
VGGEELEKRETNNCEFLRAKEGYDAIVSEQKKQNRSFAEIITKTNDAIAELSESVKLTITEIQEQIVAANSKDVANDKKLAGIHESIKILKTCSEDNKREIKELREHLDNGYQKKLRDAIEETQRKVTIQSNKELMDQMMEMLRHVVIGRTEVQATNVKKFWQFLIQITAAGGLVYMVVQLIVQVTRR